MCEAFLFATRVKSLLGSGKRGLELILVLKVEVVEILDLVTMCLLFSFGKFGIFAVNLFDLLLQMLDVLLMLFASCLQVGNVLSHFIFTLLSHERLPHTVSD